MIYKIFRADEWQALQTQGETLGAPIDIADGYIHFSTAQQAQDTADKHFANAENLTASLGGRLVLHRDTAKKSSRIMLLFPQIDLNE